MNKILSYYEIAMNAIPETVRFYLAVVILLILVISLVQFLKKNLLWIIVFIIFAPAAWPALKQIWAGIWSLVQKIPK